MSPFGQSEDSDLNFVKVDVLDPNEKSIKPTNFIFSRSNDEPPKTKSGIDEEERETPPDAIITAQKFMTAKNSKGSSPMEIDGPSYIDP